MICCLTVFRAGRFGLLRPEEVVHQSSIYRGRVPRHEHSRGPRRVGQIDVSVVFSSSSCRALLTPTRVLPRVRPFV